MHLNGTTKMLKLLGCGYFKLIILKASFFVSVGKREFITQ